MSMAGRVVVRRVPVSRTIDRHNLAKASFMPLYTLLMPVLLASAVPATQTTAEPSGSTWLNRQMLALYERTAENGWQTTPTGLRWRRVKGDGSGRHPTVEDTITVHYVGTFVDGTEFDNSIKRGEPATFPLGNLIAGWRESAPLAGIGDTIEIAIPHQLAYGPEGKDRRGKHVVPGGATLLFTIQLIDIPAPATP